VSSKLPPHQLEGLGSGTALKAPKGSLKFLNLVQLKKLRQNETSKVTTEMHNNKPTGGVFNCEGGGGWLNTPRNV